MAQRTGEASDRTGRAGGRGDDPPIFPPRHDHGLVGNSRVRTRQPATFSRRHFKNHGAQSRSRSGTRRTSCRSPEPQTKNPSAGGGWRCSPPSRPATPSAPTPRRAGKPCASRRRGGEPMHASGATFQFEVSECDPPFPGLPVLLRVTGRFSEPVEGVTTAVVTILMDSAQLGDLVAKSRAAQNDLLRVAHDSAIESRATRVLREADSSARQDISLLMALKAGLETYDVEAARAKFSPPPSA